MTYIATDENDQRTRVCDTCGSHVLTTNCETVFICRVCNPTKIGAAVIEQNSINFATLKENAEAGKFIQTNGTVTTMRCPHCGSATPDNGKYCAYCGRRQAANYKDADTVIAEQRAARRVAAIAEAAGITRTLHSHEMIFEVRYEAGGICFLLPHYTPIKVASVITQIRNGAITGVEGTVITLQW